MLSCVISKHSRYKWLPASQPSTAAGLILDMIGAALVGLLATGYEVIRADGGPARPEGLGQHLHRWGWLLMIAGFALQLYGSLVRPSGKQAANTPVVAQPVESLS